MEVRCRQTDKQTKISALSITAEMSGSDKDARGTLWQITIFNYRDVEVTDEESANRIMAMQLPPGWKLYGQLERCPKSDRLHIQGHVKTPQVRWSAVQKEFRGCHFELAKNKQALMNYDKKSDTRVAELVVADGIPTLWDYSRMVAEDFPFEEYQQRIRDLPAKEQTGDEYSKIRMQIVDEVVSRHIRDGRRGCEFIATNPLFRSAWKRFGSAMLDRDRKDRENHDDLEDQEIDRS